MDRKRIITERENLLYSALIEDGRLVGMDIFPADTDRIATDSIRTETVPSKACVGDIFVGKIRDIVPNINAAFVEIANGEICYLSLESFRRPIFLNSKKNDTPHQGDLLLVQISHEPVKTKPAAATIYFAVTGRYLVLTHGKNYIGLSKKIGKEESKRHLKELLRSRINDQYGFIIRTNAQYATEEEILAEADSLCSVYGEICRRAQYASGFTKIYQAPEYYLADIRDDQPLQGDDLSEIITDCPDIYKKIREFLSIFRPQMLSALSFYEDDMISLWNVYGLQAKLERALGKKVWLPCGGYLVIEPTEALTVIDVNSGKAVSKKKHVDEVYFKINQEAVEEIAIQLRVRNLSGIIIVDFIDMKQEEHTQKIAYLLKQELKKDPVKAEFVDITRLHLAEITRKRTRKPLYEQV